MQYFAKMLPYCGADNSYYNSNGSCRTVEERTVAIEAQNTQGMLITTGIVTFAIVAACIVAIIVRKKLMKGKK